MGAVTDHARDNGLSEYLPIFLIGGVEVPTISGQMDVPDGRPGKTLTITLSADQRAAAAINASVEYRVRVTNIIGTETVTRFKGRIVQRRFDTRVDSNGWPADVLVVDCVSYMAERCRKAPEELHVIYDPNRINDGTTGETIAQRILDTRPQVLRADGTPAFTLSGLARVIPDELKIESQDLPLDEDGDRIQPLYESTPNLTLQLLLERCLEQGCGFADATMTIPNYPIGRLDVTPEGGWFDALAALLQAHEPIWVEDEVANTIKVVQPEWTLPGGYVPPEIHLDRAIPSLSESQAEIRNQIEVVYRHNGAEVAVGWAAYRGLTALENEDTATATDIITYGQTVLAAAQQAISNDDGGAAVWLAAKALGYASAALERAQSEGDPAVIAQAQQFYNDSLQAVDDADALANGQDDYVFPTTFQYPPSVNIDGGVTTTEWRTDIDFRAKSNPEVILSSQLLSLMRKTTGPGGVMSIEVLDNYYDGMLKVGHFKSVTGNLPAAPGDPIAQGTILEETCEIQWERMDGQYVQVRQAVFKSGVITRQEVNQNGTPRDKLTPAMQANVGQIGVNTEDIPQSNEWGDIELDVERTVVTRDGLTLQEKVTHDLVTGNIHQTQSWTRTGKPSVGKKNRTYQYGGGGREAGSYAGAEVRVVLKDAASIADNGVRKAGAFDAGEMPRDVAFALARLLFQPDPAEAQLQIPDPDFSLNRGEVRRIFDRDGDQGLFVCTGLSEGWGEDQWLSQTAAFRKRRVVA